MFTENMIAPCGLDCSLCQQAHSREAPCPGCLGSDEDKPDFCSAQCAIIHCGTRKARSYRFCDECPEFPCEAARERENRYMSQYVLRESPFGNLREIRQNGMDAFLRRQKERWSCGQCGGVVSVHTGLCRDCGKQYDAASFPAEAGAVSH